MDAGPERGQAHQIVAVAEHGDRQPIAPGVAQRERRAHRHARPRADAAAAVEADVIVRMREAAMLTWPAERQPDVRRTVRRKRVRRHPREIVERKPHVGGPLCRVGARTRGFRGSENHERAPSPRGPSASSSDATSESGAARIETSVAGSAW